VTAPVGPIPTGLEGRFVVAPLGQLWAGEMAAPTCSAAGCGRGRAPGRTPRGNCWRTCCKGCATGGEHDAGCDDRWQQQQPSPSPQLQPPPSPSQPEPLLPTPRTQQPEPRQQPSPPQPQQQQHVGNSSSADGKRKRDEPSFVRIFTWNAGSLCPQSSMTNKLVKLAPLLNSDDLIFLPEVKISKVAGARKKQLAVLQHYEGYTLHTPAEDMASMAVYQRDSLHATVWFPPAPALRNSVAVVEGVGVSGTWAVVGVYAPNMKVGRGEVAQSPHPVRYGECHKAAGPIERRAYDEALFALLERLSISSTPLVSNSGPAGLACCPAFLRAVSCRLDP
jgi:hypothetical protein